MSDDENPPAFSWSYMEKHPYGFDVHRNERGMTLRDYFAAAALQGILYNSDAFSNMSDMDVAENSWRAADAMLAARAK
jgi:hypothetical protein